MKKIFLSIGAILLVGVIALAAYLGYLGMFSELTPVETVMGPHTFVYEESIGPYKETGPVFDRVYKSLEKENIKPKRGMGIYFDNPAEVPEEKLRSHCGSLIEGENVKKFAKVRDKFKVAEIPESKVLRVEFPIKSAMSYMIGPMKCYPFLNKYAKEKKYRLKGKAYELYDMEAAKTFYVFPIEE